MALASTGDDSACAVERADVMALTPGVVGLGRGAGWADHRVFTLCVTTVGKSVDGMVNARECSSDIGRLGRLWPRSWRCALGARGA